MLSLLGQTIFNTCIYYTVKPVLNQKFCVQNRQVFELVHDSAVFNEC
jgi:hypothetical protein